MVESDFTQNAEDIRDDSDSDWEDDRRPLSNGSVSRSRPVSFDSVHEGVDAATAPIAEAPASSSTPETSTWTGILNRFRRAKPISDESSAPVNDGVFGNLVAKEEVLTAQENSSSFGSNVPGNPHDDDLTPAEEPPTYEEASADATPSYWETTVMATDWGAEVIVGDMPVGSFLHFAWNMLVSVAFSYLGFFITYLFHTSHAAKGGSIAGLGATLIQSSYDWRVISAAAPGPPPDEFAPRDPNSFEDGPAIGYVMHPTGQSASREALPEQSSLMSQVIFAVGVALVCKGSWDYIRARSIQQAILRQQNEAQAEAQPEVEAQNQQQQLPGIGVIVEAV